MPKTLPARTQTEVTPWSKYPGETARAFAAFTRYRDLAENRSLVRVGQELGRSRQLLERWSARWNWVGRCDAYDRHLDELDRADQVRERRAMPRRQAEAGVLLQDVAGEGLAELERRMAQGLPLNLTPDQIVRLIEIGTKIERTARGEDSVQSRYQKIEVVIAESLKEYDDDDVAGQNF